jgi:hypothetical protein
MSRPAALSLPALRMNHPVPALLPLAVAAVLVQAQVPLEEAETNLLFLSKK